MDDIDSKCWSQDELASYAGELWVTQEQFEKELHEDVKGYMIEKDMMERFYLRKLDWMKEKSAF